MPIFKTSKKGKERAAKGKERAAAKRLKAIIHLNGVPDHIKPYDYKYCVRLAFKYDPEGKFIRVQVTE